MRKMTPLKMMYATLDRYSDIIDIEAKFENETETEDETEE